MKTKLTWKRNGVSPFTYYTAGNYTIEKRGPSWRAFDGFRTIGNYNTLRQAKAECEYHNNPNPITAINAVCSQ